MSQVLGRGELHFSLFRPGTQTPSGFRYIGNTPEFNLTIASENLDHFNSDRGIREKDNSIVIETTRTGSFITDVISAENLALFFFGSSGIIAQTTATGTVETLTDVSRGRSYQLGATTNNPTGVRSVTITTIVVGATPLVLGTDYTVDTELGIITILPGSTVVLGDGTSDVVVTYNRAAVSREQIISGTTPIEGALRFISYNPTGPKRDFYMAYVKMTPNGDFALKGEDWQQIPFNLEILSPASGVPAILADGRPYVAV